MQSRYKHSEAPYASFNSSSLGPVAVGGSHNPNSNTLTSNPLMSNRQMNGPQDERQSLIYTPFTPSSEVKGAGIYPSPNNVGSPSGFHYPYASQPLRDYKHQMPTPPPHFSTSYGGYVQDPMLSVDYGSVISSGSYPMGRSPSRQMRISYVEAWEPSGSRNPVQMVAHTEILSDHQKRQKSLSSRSSSRVLSPRYKMSWAASLCPGCSIFNLVSAVSFLQICAMGVLYCASNYDSKYTFNYLIDSFAVNGEALMQKSEIYRLFTSLFIHANWRQLLMNIFCQQQLGSLVTLRFKSMTWFKVWILSGIIGSVIGALLEPTQTFLSPTAASAGVTGFHVSEICFIWPFLAREIKPRIQASVILAFGQILILCLFDMCLISAILTGTVVGFMSAVIMHQPRNGAGTWLRCVKLFCVMVLFVLLVMIASKYSDLTTQPHPSSGMIHDPPSALPAEISGAPL